MKTLLLKELNAEIDSLLNTVYKDKFIMNNPKTLDMYKNPATLGNVSEMTLNQLRYITGVREYATSEEELYDTLLYFSESRQVNDKKQLLKLLPIIKHILMGDDNRKKVTAINTIMRVHVGDYRKFELDNNGPKVLSILLGIDSILSTKHSHFDMDSCMCILEYVNTVKRSLLVPEYRKELEKYYDKLYSMMEFYMPEEFITAFENGTLTDDAKTISQDNINLVKFFCGFSVERCRNLYYTYKSIDDMLKLHDDQKVASLVRFCYTTYTSEEFSEQVGDISLEDVYEFIKTYELSGNTLNNQQLEKLFINYRKHYLDRNNKLSDYQKEVSLIKAEYNDYIRQNFAYTTKDFIDYFNKNVNHDFTCFSFSGKTTKLTKEIFEEVILGYPIGIDSINSTSVEEYRESNDHIDAEKEQQDKASKESVYNKYLYLLQYYLQTKEVTLGYFIRNNIEQEDRELFKELVVWYCRKEGKNAIASDEVQKQTTAMIVEEAINELATITLAERNELIEKYNSYLEEDNLRNHCAKLSFASIMAKAVGNRLDAIETDVIKESIKAYKNGESLIEVADKFGILVKDLDSILKRKNSPKVLANALSQERRDQKSTSMTSARKIQTNDRKTKWHQIINDLLKSDMSLVEFCEDYNRKNTRQYPDPVVSPQSIFKVLKSGVYFDPEYGNSCIDKIVTEKIIHGQLNNLPSIMFGITNGVESEDRVRNYTLFDLYVATGETVELPVVKEVLLSDSTLSEEGKRQVKVFLGKEMRRFGANFPESMNGASKDSEHIRKCSITINCADGPHEVTAEEKEEAIRFVDKMHFPSQMYIDAIYSMVRGEYDFADILVKQKEQ